MNEHQLYFMDLAILNNKSLIVVSDFPSKYWSIDFQYQNAPNDGYYRKQEINNWNELDGLIQNAGCGGKPEEFAICINGKVRNVETNEWIQNENGITIHSKNLEHFFPEEQFNFGLETDDAIYTSFKIDRQQFLDRKKELTHFELSEKSVQKDGNEYKLVSFANDNNSKSLVQIGELEGIVNQLKRIEKDVGKVCYEFDGHMIFSDMTQEEAWYETLDEDAKRFVQLENEAKSHSTPEGIAKYEELCSLAADYDPVFMERFPGIAQESLRQGYECKEMDYVIQIYERLDYMNSSLEETAEILDQSDLSEAEKNLAIWAIQELSSRGDAFYEYATNGIDIEGQNTPIIRE